jgi:hypothetical protein
MQKTRVAEWFVKNCTKRSSYCLGLVAPNTKRPVTGPQGGFLR